MKNGIFLGVAKIHAGSLTTATSFGPAVECPAALKHLAAQRSGGEILGLEPLAAGSRRVLGVETHGLAKAAGNSDADGDACAA
jgi:hypothetical protein